MVDAPGAGQWRAWIWNARDEAARLLAIATHVSMKAKIADQVGIHNVEIWAPHVEDLSVDYCREIKSAAATAGSRIVNVQLDVLNPPDYDLQAASETERVRSLAFVKQWMDRTAALVAPRIRVNPGGRPGDPVPERVIDSYRQLAAYGKTINVKVLVENHTGLSRPIPACIEIVKRVDDPFCRADRQGDRSVRYRGIYLIELWGDRQPVNVVAAVKDMMQTVAQNIRG